MIQITPQMRILVAVEPVDFRKGIDGLAALCRQASGWQERIRLLRVATNTPCEGGGTRWGGSRMSVGRSGGETV